MGRNDLEKFILPTIVNLLCMKHHAGTRKGELSKQRRHIRTLVTYNPVGSKEGMFSKFTTVSMKEFYNARKTNKTAFRKKSLAFKLCPKYPCF